MIAAWAQFFGATIIVVVGGFYLARHADRLARDTGMGRLWVGLILLATATSLPELVAGVGAIAVVDAPDLAVGSAFGSNVFNLLLIAVLAVVPAWGSLFANRSPAVSGLSRDGLILIVLALAILLAGRDTIGLPRLLILVLPVLLPLTYVVSVYRNFGNTEGIEEIEHQVDLEDGESVGIQKRPLWYSWAAYGSSASLVFISSLWLADNADLVAVEMNWSRSFMGSALMAASTSLPELVVAVAALRMHAPGLALANLLGSNMFNMGGVLAADALASGSHPLFSRVSTEHIASGVAAIAMTILLMRGPLVLRNHMKGRGNRTGVVRLVVFLGIFIVANATIFASS